MQINYNTFKIWVLVLFLPRLSHENLGITFLALDSHLEIEDDLKVPFQVKIYTEIIPLFSIFYIY